MTYAPGALDPAALWPAAVLRRPTLTALTALLATPTGAMSAWAAWQAAIAEQPATLDDQWRRRTLHQLRYHRPDLFRLWQQRALDYFRQTGETAEQLFHFDQLAESLLVQQAYGDLARLIDTCALPDIRQARHLHTYLSGVLACEDHRHTTATTVFENLLTEPDLDPTLSARVWNSLGVNAQYRGRYDEALRCYRRAHALFVAQDNRLGQAKTLFNLGATHRHLHELQVAAITFQNSLALLEQLDARDWQTFALNGLGLVYTALGCWSEAEHTYLRVASICQLASDNEGAGIAYTNLGELYLFSGRLTEADAALQQAAHLVTTPLALIEVLLNQGLQCAAQQDLPAAARHFEAAHALAVEHDNIRYQVWALYLHGNILRMQQDNTAAWDCYRPALALVETLRGQIEHSDIRSSLFTTWQPVYMAASLTCVELGRPTEALDVAERARARAFFDLLSRERTLPSQIVARTPLGPHDICQQLRPHTAALVFFCTGAPLTASLPVDALPANHALAPILWPPSAIIGFTVTPAGVTGQRLPLAPEVLDRRAFDHDRRTLVGLTPGDNGQLLNPWTLPIVHEALVAPLLVQLDPANVATLCIVPHGPLHRIPFQALPDPAGHDLLARGYDVVVAPSLNAWLQVTPPPPLARQDAVFGYAPNLPHAQSEALAVARGLGVPARTGEQARRDDFLTAAAQARILHCSCHGTFDRHTPLQSALHLSDGCVTAADLLAAGRLPMDLVFLSACESGRSEVEGADELMGLVRAFLLGGTHAVVVSLWRVDELATRILVEQFYQAYVAGQQPPAQALRQAQLAVRSLTWVELARGLTVNGNSLAPGNAAIERLAKMNEYWRMPDPNCPFAHPYFWAGFVMVGAQGERASEYSQTALPGRSALAGPAPEPG